MKVVVTGAAGFIGSTLCEALLAAGHEVVGIDSFTAYYARASKEANLDVARAEPSFSFVEADLTTAELAPTLAGVDAVIHEAAAPGLERSAERIAEYEVANVTATRRVAEACVATGVGHLIHASTSSVYGAEATTAEDGPTRPASPYGATKLAAEQVLHRLRRSEGLPVTILRYFSVYGPRQRPDMAYRRFCERLLCDEPVIIYGDGCQSRSNTYVTDCVAATVAALDRPAEGATYNVGGGQEVKLLDAVAILGDALGIRPRIEHAAARPGDQVRTAANITRARGELGWAPVVEPEDGLVRQALWVEAERRHGPNRRQNNV